MGTPTSTDRGEVRTINPDVRQLWRAFALSEFGVAFSAGAAAVIAVQELDASGFELALVLGGGGVAASMAALPLGPMIERRAKRPVMVAADVGRAIAIGLVPLTWWLGVLDLVVLGLLLAVNVMLGIAFSAASGAHLKQLVEPVHWARVNARFEETRWAVVALVTPLGGVVVLVVGPAVTMSVDALTFVGSAVILRRITRPEPPPACLDDRDGRLAEITTGWRYIQRTRPLAMLFANAIAFGGCVTLIGPLLAIFVLRDLGLNALHYGLLLGLPAAGGALGARLAPRLQSRLGWRRALLWPGAARTVWMAMIPLAPHGGVGFSVLLVAETGLMLAAGMFNPIFATYRFRLTADDHMARVGTSWSVTARATQPLFILVGGVAAGLIGIRATIAATAVVALATSALLPWRASRAEANVEPVTSRW